MKYNELDKRLDKKDFEEISSSRWELLKLINQKINSFEQYSSKRDRREIAACIVSIVIFGIYFFATPSILKKAGCMAIIGAATLVICKLKMVSLQLAKKDKRCDNQSIEQYLTKELRRVKTWKTMLENIAWWYILPLSIGLVLLTAGSQSKLIFKVNYLQVVAGLGVWIWYMHQRTVSSKLEPLIYEIKQSIRFVKYSKM